jgi:hypothetical protein
VKDNKYTLICPNRSLSDKKNRKKNDNLYLKSSFNDLEIKAGKKKRKNKRRKQIGSNKEKNMYIL